MVMSSKSFSSKSFDYDLLFPWLGNGLVTASGNFSIFNTLTFFSFIKKKKKNCRFQDTSGLNIVKFLLRLFTLKSLKNLCLFLFQIVKFS